MKPRLFINLSFFSLILLFQINLQAAHIIGGTMSYECLGNGDYKFTMEIYRDCQAGGSGFDSSPSGAVIGSATVYSGDLTAPYLLFDLEAPIIEEIDPSASHPGILFPPEICIEKGTYVFELNLPLSIESYHITYQRCCRNASVTNILEPTSVGITVCTELTPNAQSLCNNSPTFQEVPTILLIDTLLEYNYAAVDIDGDSLVYEFCCPFAGGGIDQINYTEPQGVAPDPDTPPPYEILPYIIPTYSCEEPFGGNSSISIDPNTGIVSGTPEVIGFFATGVCISEYRNGELIGRTRRDLQSWAVPLEYTNTKQLNPARLLKIAPNPATIRTIIELPDASKKYDLSIWDLNGQLIQQEFGIQSKRFMLSTANFQEGIYLVELRNEGERFLAKLVIQ